nr:hypothetical protein K-LCC10_0473 [Kaumoebavirus]
MISGIASRCTSAGDAVLIGNDGIEIRTFSELLKASPYFEAAIRFQNGNLVFKFEDYDNHDLYWLVMVMVGRLANHFVKITDKRIEMLKYFQFELIPTHIPKEYHSTLSAINLIQYDISIGDKPALCDFVHICRKIIKEKSFRDEIVIKWFDKYCTRYMNEEYTKILWIIIRSINGDLDLRTTTTDAFIQAWALVDEDATDIIVEYCTDKYNHSRKY